MAAHTGERTEQTRPRGIERSPIYWVILVILVALLFSQWLPLLANGATGSTSCTTTYLGEIPTNTSCHHPSYTKRGDVHVPFDVTFKRDPNTLQEWATIDWGDPVTVEEGLDALLQPRAASAFTGWQAPRR